MMKFIFILILSFNLLSSNENIVKTSELELVIFKMAYESLLKDVKKTKTDSTLNENDIKNINKKVEMIMNELFKDKRILVQDIKESPNDIDIKKIKEFKEEIISLKKELILLKDRRKNQIEKIEEKTPTSLKVKENNISADIIKQDFKKIYNTKRFNALKCFDYEFGSVLLSDKCKSDILNFVNKNKRALRFELIPIITNDDYPFFNEIEENLELSELVKVTNYFKEGLSRKRVTSAWDYVNSINEDFIVTTSNYYVESESYHGIVLRAYYKDFD